MPPPPPTGGFGAGLGPGSSVTPGQPYWMSASANAHPDTIAAAHQDGMAQTTGGGSPGARAAAAVGGSPEYNFTSPVGQKQLLGS